MKALLKRRSIQLLAVLLAVAYLSGLMPTPSVSAQSSSHTYINQEHRPGDAHAQFIQSSPSASVKNAIKASESTVRQPVVPPAAAPAPENRTSDNELIVAFFEDRLTPLATARGMKASQADMLAEETAVVESELADAGIAVRTVDDPLTLASDGLQLVSVELSQSGNIQEAIESLTALDSVAYAEPKIFGNVTGFNDPLADDQWGLKTIDGYDIYSDPAVRAHIGDVTVAVIDTGIMTEHRDLTPNIVAGYDFIERDTVPQDEFGHGTHCAGILAAVSDNELGMASAASGAHIMPVRVLDAFGYGDNMTVARGVIYAVNNGADIISMSLGFFEQDETLKRAIAYAVERNVLVVAATGNEYSKDGSFIRFPAAYDGVLAVGALDADQRNGLYEAPYSNYRQDMSNLIYAPGSMIISTYSDGEYVTMDGTSMATPFVASMAAAFMARSDGALRGNVLLDKLLAESCVMPRRYFDGLSNAIVEDTAEYHVVNDNGLAGYTQEDFPDAFFAKSLSVSIVGETALEVTKNSNRTVIEVTALNEDGTIDTEANQEVRMGFSPCYPDQGEFWAFPYIDTQLTHGSFEAGKARFELDLSLYAEMPVYLGFEDAEGTYGALTCFVWIHDPEATAPQITMDVLPPEEYRGDNSPYDWLLQPYDGSVEFYYTPLSEDPESDFYGFLNPGMLLWNDETKKLTLTIGMPVGRYQFYISVADTRFQGYNTFVEIGAPIALTETGHVFSHQLSRRPLPPLENVLTINAGDPVRRVLTENDPDFLWLKVNRHSLQKSHGQLVFSSEQGVQFNDVRVFRFFEGQLVEEYLETSEANGKLHLYMNNDVQADNLYFLLQKSDGSVGVELRDAYSFFMNVEQPEDVIVLTHIRSGDVQVSSLYGGGNMIRVLVPEPRAQIFYTLEQTPETNPEGPYALFGVVTRQGEAYGMSPLSVDAVELNEEDMEVSATEETAIPISVIPLPVLEPESEKGGPITLNQYMYPRFHYLLDEDFYRFTVDRTGPVYLNAVARLPFELDVFNSDGKTVAMEIAELNQDLFDVKSNAYILQPGTYTVHMKSVLDVPAWELSMEYQSNRYFNICGDGGYKIQVSDADAAVPVKSIEILSLYGTNMVTPGGALKLLAAVLPASATDKSVVWSVTQPNGEPTELATINQTGDLIGVSPGLVVVHARACDGSQVVGSKEIRILTSYLTCRPAVQTCRRGKKVLLTFFTDAPAECLSFTSTNPTVAAVSQMGEVIGIKQGMAVITVRANDGSGLVSQVLVTVTA